MIFSLFGHRCLFGLCGVSLRDGDNHRGWIFNHDGPSRLSPGDGVWSLEVLLRKCCSLFSDASPDQRAMVLSGTSHCFVTSSAHSSLRAFASSRGQICSILALSRIAW